MRIALAVMLFGHGFAHLPGFIISWQLAAFRELTYRTTLLGGRADVGSAGIRVVGVLWLLTAIALAVCAAAVLMQASWSMPATLSAVTFSLILCVAAWPDSRIGAFVDVALIISLLAIRP